MIGQTTTVVLLEPQIPPNLWSKSRQFLRYAFHILVTGYKSVESARCIVGIDIPSSADTDNSILVFLHGLGQLNSAPDCMSSLSSGTDALQLTEQLEPLESLSIGNGNKICAS